MLQETVIDHIADNLSLTLQPYFDEIGDICVTDISRRSGKRGIEETIVEFFVDVRKYGERRMILFKAKATPYVITYPSIFYSWQDGININLNDEDIDKFMFPHSIKKPYDDDQILWVEEIA